MNTSVEKLENDRARITMSNTAAEVDAAIKGAYARIARKVKIQGFRPGKAPRNVIDTHVGRESVLVEALQDLVDLSYANAIEETGLQTHGRPDTGELEELEEGKEYTFTAEIGLRPELTITSAEGFEATLNSAKASDADIDAEIEYLRDRYATLEVVEGRGVADNDFVLLSFTGTVDGEAADDLVVDKFLYEMSKGIMPAEFDAALLGANPGDTVHARFPVPETAANETYRGKDADFDIEIHEVKAKIMPAIDDEFASNVGGFETVEDLRADVSKKFITRRFEELPRLMEREALDTLAERLEGEVPKELVNERARSMTDDFYVDMEKRGVSVDDYYERTQRTVDDVFEDMLELAKTNVRDELALEALYRQAGLDYGDEAMEAEIAAIATEDKTPVATMKKRLLERGVMPYMRRRLRQRTAARWLLDNITWHQPDQEGAEPAEKPAAKKKAPAKKAAVKKDAAPAKKKAADEGKNSSDKPAKKAAPKKKDA